MLMSSDGADAAFQAGSAHEHVSTDAAPLQVVDPTVSRAKFDQEIDQFRKIERDQQRRGWWMLDATFPTVFVVFASPRLKPPAVVCGVLLDFTNYDLEPPSVRLVDPFSREPYQMKDLPTALLRQQLVSVPGAQPAAPGAPAMQFASNVPLMQAHSPDDVPFLCIPGVREYHAHPAHTGDPWLAHRSLGAGTLYNILQTIFQYGVQPITNYNIGLQVVGFEQAQPPR